MATFHDVCRQPPEMVMTIRWSCVRQSLNPGWQLLTWTCM